MSFLFASLILLPLCLIAGGWWARAFAQKSYNPSHFQDSLHAQKAALEENAQFQRTLILEEALAETKKQYEQEQERLENERVLLQKLHVQEETLLDERQQEIENFASQLEERQQQLQEKEAACYLQAQDLTQKQQTLQELRENTLHVLEEKSHASRAAVKTEYAAEFLEQERLACNGFLLEATEQIKADAAYQARKILESVHVRYQPTFIWPKSAFLIPLEDHNANLAKHFEPESPLSLLLTAETEVSLSLVAIEEGQPSSIKIAGGAGFDKEIIRLTLEEMVSKNLTNSGKISALLRKNKQQIEQTMKRLGEQAAKTLGLKQAPHPEILRLVGALNYRTSHRQNQYHHSLEVAVLAGMLAAEVGVDPFLAKRAGLLHDIGKVLDYKIEGSHAVISGDYATRYGENEEVVDTVLAHHDDKIVETPYAYILKAADALSGARPGARVDMVEGYHRRIDGISHVVQSFAGEGVVDSAIMSAGREIRIYVDSNKVGAQGIAPLAKNIAEQLEAQVEYPGQIRVTVVRRTEATEVA